MGKASVLCKLRISTVIDINPLYAMFTPATLCLHLLPQPHLCSSIIFIPRVSINTHLTAQTSLRISLCVFSPPVSLPLLTVAIIKSCPVGSVALWLLLMPLHYSLWLSARASADWT